MTNELKLAPCPFCGGEAVALLDEDNCPYVCCPSCHSSIPAHRQGFEHMAIAAWNQRANEREPGTVPIPDTVDMARLMLGLGYRYLQENAPEQLASPSPASDAELPTFDAVWDAIDWDKWRAVPVRELVRHIHTLTTPGARAASTRTASDTRTAAGEAECDAALGRAAPASQHDAAAQAKFGPQGDDPTPEWFYLLHAAAEALGDNGCTANAESVREIAALLLWSPYQRGEVVVDDRGLPELRERLSLASILGEPITLSHNAAFALYNAMSTSIPATAEQMSLAGSAREGGNTQPVSVESTRPAEVDVEAERRSARENLRASGKVPMVGWTLSDAYSEGWLAARTQADAGKDAEIVKWARQLAEDYPSTLAQFHRDEVPIGSKLVKAVAAMLSGAQIAEGE